MKRQLLFAMLSCLLAFSGLFVMYGFAMPTAHGEATTTGPACILDYDKSASPTEVDAGGATTITFALQAVGDCSAANSPVDVMLVLDRSGSMSGQPLADTKNASINFMNIMDLSVDQVGVASFASRGAGTLDSPLSQDGTSVANAINSLVANGRTDMVNGLEFAETELITSGNHIPSNAPVIIILSDGHHNASPTGELNDTANRIKGAGIRIISIGIGLGVNQTQLRDIASSADDYYYVPNSADLMAIYQSIAGTIRVAARDMTLTDTLSIYDTLIPGTFQGPILPTVNGNQIVWHIAAVPTSTLSLSYQVAMTSTAGTWPTNESAIASYINTNGDPISVTFPVPQVTVNGICGPPTLNQVEPGWGCEGSDVEVEFFGSGFFEPSASIGGEPLTLDTIEADYLHGTLPSGLSAGTYDATVVNSCQESVTLPDAFTIYPAPDVLNIRPSEGYGDIPSDITICGTGFTPSTTVSIELPGGTILLENQGVYGESCMVGTIPEGLPPGQYPIVVEGACGSASGTYTVLDVDLNDDLWAEGDWLWEDPAYCARLSEDIKIGLVVNRRGGRSPVSVDVNFYEGDPNSPDAVFIGQGNIPLIPARVGPNERINGFSTSEVDWDPSQGDGEYTLYAVIDPDNDVPEDIEYNNVVSRTVLVLPGTDGIDNVAPRVDVLQINGVISPTTVYDPQVDLHVESEDFVQSGVISSGVANMLFVEYLFNEAASVWTPVQTSDWLTFTQDSTWDLHPQGGLRFIQAWTVDGAGNISRYANQKSVNYAGTCTPISRDGAHVYRQDVNAGDMLHIELAPCDGDPDLYVWPPNVDTGQPPWVSNQEGNAIETLSIPIDTSGEHQIEVYGYTAAEYNISIEVEPGGAHQPGARTVEHRSGKPVPESPTLPTSNRPDPSDTRGLLPPPVDPDAGSQMIFSLYLPAITR